MITLKTLPEATAQEVFDQAARHLLKQGKKSAEPGTTKCLYRGPDGLTCVAGCFIADDEYSPRMENEPWNNLVRVDAAVPPDHAGLILDLQNVHDESETYLWLDDLAEVAEDHNLSPAVLEEFK